MLLICMISEANQLLAVASWLAAQMKKNEEREQSYYINLSMKPNECFSQ